MTIKRHLSSLLIVASLASIALPAVAATTHWHAYRQNLAGVSAITLPTTSNHFCYLSKVGIEETDTSNESATCRVHLNGTRWVLQAILGRNSDADVYCAAYCYNK